MNRAHVLTFVFAFGSIAVVACGGVDQPDLFGPAGSTSGSGTDGGSSTTKDGGSGSDASTSTDAGGGTDSGTVVVVDSGGPTTGSSGIYCGSTGGTDLYCSGGNICCVRNNQGGAGVLSYECTGEDACDGDDLGDLTIPCARKSDCKGAKQACCGTFVTGSPSYYDEVTCDNDCTDTDDRVFCDPAKGNDDCPSPQTCQTSGAMPGFHVCGS